MHKSKKILLKKGRQECSCNNSMKKTDFFATIYSIVYCRQLHIDVFPFNFYSVVQTVISQILLDTNTGMVSLLSIYLDPQVG
jgi:hypothetical protein